MAPHTLPGRPPTARAATASPGRPAASDRPACTADAVPGGAARPTGGEAPRSPPHRRSASDRTPAHPEPGERPSTRSYEQPHHRACRTASAQASAVTLTWHPTRAAGAVLLRSPRRVAHRRDQAAAGHLVVGGRRARGAAVLPRRRHRGCGRAGPGGRWRRGRARAQAVRAARRVCRRPGRDAPPLAAGRLTEAPEHGGDGCAARRGARPVGWRTPAAAGGSRLGPSRGLAGHRGGGPNRARTALGWVLSGTPGWPAKSSPTRSSTTRPRPISVLLWTADSSCGGDGGGAVRAADAVRRSIGTKPARTRPWPEHLTRPGARSFRRSLPGRHRLHEDMMPVCRPYGVLSCRRPLAATVMAIASPVIVAPMSISGMARAPTFPER